VLLTETIEAVFGLNFDSAVNRSQYQHNFIAHRIPGIVLDLRILAVTPASTKGSKLQLTEVSINQLFAQHPLG
jgi:hypothetical protein